MVKGIKFNTPTERLALNPTQEQGLTSSGTVHIMGGKRLKMRDAEDGDGELSGMKARRIEPFIEPFGESMKKKMKKEKKMKKDKKEKKERLKRKKMAEAATLHLPPPASLVPDPTMPGQGFPALSAQAESNSMSDPLAATSTSRSPMRSDATGPSSSEGSTKGSRSSSRSLGSTNSSVPLPMPPPGASRPVAGVPAYDMVAPLTRVHDSDDERDGFMRQRAGSESRKSKKKRHGGSSSRSGSGDSERRQRRQMMMMMPPQFEEDDEEEDEEEEQKEDAYGSNFGDQEAAYAAMMRGDGNMGADEDEFDGSGDEFSGSSSDGDEEDESSVSSGSIMSSLSSGSYESSRRHRVPLDKTLGRMKSSKARAEAGLPPTPFGMTEEEADEAERQDLLMRLTMLKSRGIKLTKNFTAQSNLNELRMEVGRIQHEQEQQRSVLRMRRWLMLGVSGVERASTSRVAPKFARGRMSGFSSYVLDSIDDFNDAFEALGEKYGGRMAIGGTGNPLMDIAMLLMTQVFMYIFIEARPEAKKLTEEDIKRDHPALVRTVALEMANQMRAQDLAQERELREQRERERLYAQEQLQREHERQAWIEREFNASLMKGLETAQPPMPLGLQNPSPPEALQRDLSPPIRHQQHQQQPQRHTELLGSHSGLDFQPSASPVQFNLSRNNSSSSSNSSSTAKKSTSASSTPASGANYRPSSASSASNGSSSGSSGSGKRATVFELFDDNASVSSAKSSSSKKSTKSNGSDYSAYNGMTSDAASIFDLSQVRAKAAQPKFTDAFDVSNMMAEVNEIERAMILKNGDDGRVKINSIPSSPPKPGEPGCPISAEDAAAATKKAGGSRISTSGSAASKKVATKATSSTKASRRPRSASTGSSESNKSGKFKISFA